MTGPTIQAGVNYHANVWFYDAAGDKSAVATSDSLTPISTPGVPGTMSGGGCACGYNGVQGDPVDTMTGQVTEHATDLTQPGPGQQFTLGRSYRSDASNTAGLLGKGWALALESSLSINATSGAITLIDDDQAQVVFSKNPDGSFATPRPVRYTLATVSGGGYTVTALDRSVRTYDSTGHLKSTVDGSGKGLTLAYTAGAISSVTDAVGRTASFAVYPTTDPAAGLLQKVTLPDGRSVSYTYTNRQLTGVTDVNGGLTQYHYDTAGRLDTITDQNTHVITQNHYDPTTGRIDWQTDANNNKWLFAWKATPNTVPGTGESDVTDPQNGIWTDVYEGGVLTNHYDPYGHGPQRGYDTSLNVTYLIDSNGHGLQATYFPNGDIRTRTDPVSGAQESWTYDAPGVMHTHVDYGGNTWKYDHDPATMRLLDEIDPLGNKTSYSYNAAGQILTKTTPRGNANNGALASKYTTTYAYDPSGNGQLLGVMDGLGNKTTYTYWPSGQVKTEVDPRGNVAGADASKFTTSYTYDTQGHVLTTKDANGNVTTNHYDPAGNLDWSEDGEHQRTDYKYDNASQLTDTIDPSKADNHTDYFPGGLVKDTIDPLGHMTSYTYDAANHVHTVVSARGNLLKTDPNYADPSVFTTTYAYDANGNRTMVTDPLNNATRTEYDADNRPWRVTDPIGTASSKAGDKVPGHQTVTTYDALGNAILVSTVDANGAITGVSSSQHFDADNRVDYTVDPRGYQVGADPTKFKTTFGYDLDGNRNSQTLPMGEQTQWTYDADGHVVTTVDPRGTANNSAQATQYTTTNQYDPAGHLTQTQDGTGAITQYGYDGAGNKTSIVDPRGFLPGNKPTDYTTIYGFDADNRQTSVLLPKTPTAPNPVPAITGYDAAGNVASVTDPLGNMTRFGYDDARHKTSVTTPRGNTGSTPDPNYTTNFGYDADGNQKTVTDPPTAQVPHPVPTVTDYDPLNRAIDRTDPVGNKAIIDYNQLGQIDWIKDGRQYVTKFGYDQAGHRTSVTDPRGNTTATPDPAYTATTVFDFAGNQISQSTAMGEQTTYTYDVDGRRVAQIDPRGNAAGVTDPTVYQTSFGYDLAGNQTTVTDPLKHTITTQYDAANRKLSVTDPLSHTTKYHYWPSGAVNTVTDPMGNVTTYVYDQAGNLSTRTDANTHATAYGYDAARRLQQTTDPLSRVTKYGYDADGNLATSTDARNITTTITSDARNLQTGVSYSDGTPAVSFTFDAAHQLTGITDATGSQTRTYDPNGRLLSATSPLVGGKAFTYSYDPTGEPASRTYPDGEQTTYQLDRDGRIESQTADGGTVTYGYDPAGHLTTTQLPPTSGYIETRHYDPAGRLASIDSTKNGTALSSWAYKYNNADHPTEVDVTRAGTGQSPRYYTYDNNGRLQAWCTSSATCTSGADVVSYTYDNVGNRKTMTKAGRTTNYNYDAADELTSTATGLIRQNYTYDAAGNMTGNGSTTNTITYDATNHPAAAVQGSTTYKFTNDYLGDRAVTSTGGTTTATDLWDTNGDLPQLATETGASGNLVGDFHPDVLGQPLSEHTTGGAYFYAHDALGSVTDVTDSTGTPQYQNSYDPYGVQTATSLNTTAPKQQFGFAGQMTDQALTGEQTMRARDYDPVTGRFTGQDPIRLRIADPYVSAYIYASDGPTYAVDPSGLSSTDPDSVAEDVSAQILNAFEELAEQAVACGGLDNPSNYWAEYCTGHAVTVHQMAWQISVRNVLFGRPDGQLGDLTPLGNVSDPPDAFLTNGVTTSDCDNRIPNASKEPPASGNEADREAGKADIVDWGTTVVRIWEVKHTTATEIGTIGHGDAEINIAPDQLRRYVQMMQIKLRRDGDPRLVEAGYDLLPAQGIPDWYRIPWVVDMWSSLRTPGVIVYHERLPNAEEKRKKKEEEDKKKDGGNNCVTTIAATFPLASNCVPALGGVGDGQGIIPAPEFPEFGFPGMPIPVPAL